MQALFYERVEALSNRRHADLCVDMSAGHGFAARVNFVPLVLEEFEAAARHFPVVFVRQAEGFMAAALLGYGDHDNLFVDGDGRWRGDYIPAYVRRYPFILANPGDAQTFTLCIDPGYAGCNTQARGERLFLLGGGHSAYLQRMLEFARQYQAQLQAASRFTARLQRLGLLAPMQVQLALNSGEKRALGGFHTVSRERLRALRAEELAELAADDSLELVYRHLFALGSFADLLDRHAARHAA